MDYEFILYERKGKVVYITLNRPEKLNAVNDEMATELIHAAREFDADEEAWVAIVSGAGRCFCAGADVMQRHLRSREELKRRGETGVHAPGGGLGLTQSVNFKPVIAAVHGYVIGTGLTMAMDCDLVVAAEGTKFHIREVERGIGGATHWASSWFWGGARLASEMAITGRYATVEEMLPLGMVNRVVPFDQLIPTAEGMAEEIVANPPLSVRCNVRMTRWFAQQMRQQAEMYTKALQLHLTEDFRESALAFKEKRKGVYKGR